MQYLIVATNDPDGLTVVPGPGVTVEAVAEGEFETAILQFAAHRDAVLCRAAEDVAAAVAASDEDVIDAMARELGDAQLATDGPATAVIDCDADE